MAILNGLEGKAHIEITDTSWFGYILLEADMSNLLFLDIAGPQSRTVYEGSVRMNEKYFFANGKARIRKVDQTSAGTRVDFVGIDTLNLVRQLSGIPDDYLS